MTSQIRTSHQGIFISPVPPSTPKESGLDSLYSNSFLKYHSGFHCNVDNSILHLHIDIYVLTIMSHLFYHMLSICQYIFEGIFHEANERLDIYY